MASPYMTTISQVLLAPKKKSGDESPQSKRPLAVSGPSTERRSFTRRLRYDPRLPADLVEALWSNADGVVSSGEMMKPGDRCTVVCVQAAGKSWVLKRYNLRGPIHTALHLLLRSRAQNCWGYGRHLCESGVRSPLPMAFLEHRFGPFRTRSYLVTEFVPGTLMTDFVAQAHAAPQVLEALSSEFGDTWRQLGSLRLSHGDMKATNFLVTEGPEVWVIDLDAMCRHRFDLTRQSARRRDRERFLRNWQARPRVQTLFRSAMEAQGFATTRISPAKSVGQALPDD